MCVCVCSCGTVAVVAALSELCVLAVVFDGEVGKLSPKNGSSNYGSP